MDALTFKKQKQREFGGSTIQNVKRHKLRHCEVFEYEQHSDCSEDFTGDDFDAHQHILVSHRVATIASGRGGFGSDYTVKQEWR